jgi:uncharacterized protein YidB (DUF937 family)
MGILDELKQKIASGLGLPTGAGEEAESPAFMAGVIEMLEKKGVASLIEEFKKKGLGEVVASWVGHGENLPISADTLRSVISPEAIEALAQKVGMPPGEATALLAKVLPGIVDKLTPGGVVEPPVEAR